MFSNNIAMQTIVNTNLWQDKNNGVILSCKDVTKIWKNQNIEIAAVENITLEIKKGELLAVIGPSGCGKSTLLDMIAGLEPPSSGIILNRGKLIEGVNESATLIHQKLYLFGGNTVRQNVEFALRCKGMSQEERRESVISMIDRVGLRDFIDAYPHQLSIGMQNRVAIARALIKKPEILLMDESMGSLDSQSRILMQDFLIEVLKESNTTLVYVTHQIDEAVYLADRVAIFSARPGRVKKIIPIPLKKPRNRFSKEFEEFNQLIFEELIKEVGTSMQQNTLQFV